MTTKEHRREDKATQKYSLLARFGLRHRCSQALLALREKTGCKFSTVSKLYKQVDFDLEGRTNEMMDRLLGTDTPDRKYFRAWSGE